MNSIAIDADKMETQKVAKYGLNINIDDFVIKYTKRSIPLITHPKDIALTAIIHFDRAGTPTPSK